MDALIIGWISVAVFGISLLLAGSFAKNCMAIDYSAYLREQAYSTCLYSEKNVLKEKKRLRLRIAEVRKIKNCFIFKILEKTYAFAVISFVMAFVSIVILSLTKIIAG